MIQKQTWKDEIRILITDEENLGSVQISIPFLTVSKQWFDMIVTGEKTEEYREIKPYWVRRIFDMSRALVGADTISLALQHNVIRDRKDIFKECGKALTHVLFINGYRKDSPRIEKEIESISIGRPKKGLCPDKWLGTEFIVIKFE